MDCNICICNNFQYRAWTSDFSSLSSTYCKYHIVPTWDSQDKAGFESLDIFNFFFQLAYRSTLNAPVRVEEAGLLRIDIFNEYPLSSSSPTPRNYHVIRRVS